MTRLGEPTPTALAEALKLSKPSVSAIVNRFVKEGYVRKERSTLDRRSFHIQLTEKGQAIAASHDNMHKLVAQ